MNTDRELLELAAKAAGYDVKFGPGHLIDDYERNKEIAIIYSGEDAADEWNPLSDDGDALRLAVKLDMIVTVNRVDELTDVSAGYNNNDLVRIIEPHASDLYAATRRAIVRAAAEVERQSAHEPQDR